MGELLEPPPGAAALALAARQYAAHLFASASHFYTGTVDRVHAFFAHVGRAENPDDADDLPGRAAWEWARFLAGWQHWRPHRLMQQLLLPPFDALNRFASLCRESAHEQTEPPAPPSRWALFIRGGSSSMPPKPRDLLTKCADILASLATVHSPEVQAILDRAATLGHEVEKHIDALPREWVPLRLSRAVAPLHEWPVEPPREVAGFLPALAGLLQIILKQPNCPEAPNVLLAIVHEARVDLKNTGQIPKEALEAAERLERNGPGDQWLQTLTLLLAVPASEAQSWSHLLARLTCQALRIMVPGFEPPLDPDTLTVPRDWFRPGRTDVRYVVHDSTPGTVVAVERFAIPPKRAAVVVSLGPRGGSAFAVAAAWDSLTGAGLDLDPCRDLLAPALEAAARRGSLIASDLLPRVTDELTKLAERGSGVESLWDVFLHRVREWAAAEDLTLLPSDWTVSDGGPAPEPAVGLNVKAVFRRDVSAGRIAKVKSFGLAGSRGVVRTGEVVVSAGSPPQGLAELEAIADSLEESAGEELREAFRALRPAGAGGYLELASVDLFTRYWDHVHPSWWSKDATAATAFGEGLSAMLRMTFKLDVFIPQNYRDYPAGWVFVPPGTRMTTGRITRVLRPGLALGDVLRVPARVEAE